MAASAVYDKLGYRNVKVLTGKDLQDKSVAFGTPVFMPITFYKVSYYDYLAQKKVSTPEIKVAACIVTVNFQKDIIKTAVQGQRRPGTFKEFINQGDYSVSIDGLLSDDNGKYPMKKTKWMSHVGIAPVMVEIEHQLLNELGIYYLVIESGGLEPKQGTEDMQPFHFDCVSDQNIELILKSEAEARKV
jgi:hypothetical protein